MPGAIRSKNNGKKVVSSARKRKANAETAAFDAYFDRKADESKRTLDRVGFPEQLVPKK